MVRRQKGSTSDSDDDFKNKVRRKKTKNEEANDESASTKPMSGVLNVRNKMVRQLLYAKLKRSKSKQQLKERKARKESGEPREQPKTIENQRKRDETWVEEDDEEALDDISNDEFNAYFTRQPGSPEPKLLLTSQEGFPTSFTNKFLKELGRILPNTTYFQRRHHPIKRIIKKMNTLGYDDETFLKHKYEYVLNLFLGIQIYLLSMKITGNHQRCLFLICLRVRR